MRFFILNWFGQKNPSVLLNKHLKYFRFWLRIRRDIQIFVHSARIIRIRKFSFHVLQNTEIFLPSIIRIRKFSFRVLSVYEQWNLVWIFTSFRIFSVYVQILSAYSQYTNRFIPCILSIRTYVRIPAFKGMLLQKKVCMCATGPKT